MSTGPSWIWIVVPSERHGHIRWEVRQIEPSQQEPVTWVAGERGDRSLAEILLLMLYQGMLASPASEWQDLLRLIPYNSPWLNCKVALFALLGSWYRAVCRHPDLAAFGETLQKTMQMVAEQAAEHQQIWYWQIMAMAGLEEIAVTLGWDIEHLKAIAEELENGQPF